MKHSKQPELQFIFHDPNPEETAKNFQKIMMEVKLEKARKIIFGNNAVNNDSNRFDLQIR